MKVTQIRNGAVAKVPTQGGERFKVPNQSVGTAELKPLSVDQSILANSANPFFMLDSSGLNDFVGLSYLTAINGSPGVGQFRSDIQNRAPIPDMSKDLAPLMGGRRIIIQNIKEVQGEIGAGNLKVYKAANDDFDQIRFVGNWIVSRSNNGARPETELSNSTDYVEIVFYGTDLNILTFPQVDQFQASIDGGAFGSNLCPAESTILNARGYAKNIVLNVASGLTAGLHTIKLKASSGFIDVYGFEIFNNSTAIKLNPGNQFIGGQLVSSGAIETIAFDSVYETVYGTPGAKGGRVLLYKKVDGTTAKAIQYVDASQANILSADHSNEEPVRTYLWREFGSQRSDDWASLGTSSSTRVYTLDDNVTSLLGVNVFSNTNVANQDGFSFSASGDFCVFTFVGCGLDLQALTQSTVNPDIAVLINNSSVGTISTSSFNTGNAPQNVKVVSGLPFGTHTVKLTRGASATGNIIIQGFKVYQPKKPALPTGCAELSDFVRPATYVANTTAGRETIGTGLIRKMNIREFPYVGPNWNISSIDAANFYSGYQVYATTAAGGEYFEYCFWGTGFEWRYGVDNGQTATAVITVDGNSNLSGYTTSHYQGGSGKTFTASTGTLAGTSTGSTYSNGITVSNIPLGFHKVRITKSATSGTLYTCGLDIISPTFSYGETSLSSQRNGLAIGGNNLGDSRLFTPVANLNKPLDNAVMIWGQSSSPTTTVNVYTPMPDMGYTMDTGDGFLLINFVASTFHSIAGSGCQITMYVDGKAVTPENQPENGSAATLTTAALTALVPVAKGTHRVEIYWKTGSGTATAAGTRRMLSIVEL